MQLSQNVASVFFNQNVDDGKPFFEQGKRTISNGHQDSLTEFVLINCA